MLHPIELIPTSMIEDAVGSDPSLNDHAPRAIAKPWGLMNRRQALRAAGVVAVGLVLHTPHPVLANDDSVSSSPTADAPSLYAATEIEAMAGRKFSGKSGRLQVYVVIFDGIENAEQGFDAASEGWLDGFASQFDVSDVELVDLDNRPTDVDMVAYAGAIPVSRGPSPIYMGMLLTRDERVVRMYVSAGPDEGTLPSTLDVHEAIEDRLPSKEPEMIDDTGMHTGGIWTMLPTPMDVPFGLEFKEDDDGRSRA